MEEPDPQRRERLLVQSVFEADLAAAVAIYAEGQPWIRLLGSGATGELPGASLVESVAAREIGPELPPDGLVLVSGDAPHRRALVLAGAGCKANEDTREDRSDLLESLLMLLTCLDSAVAGDPDQIIADRVLPPFQRQDTAERSACARVAPDLRDLLRSIRARQEELHSAADALDEERLSLSEVVDRECQAAGDLLLDAYAERSKADEAGEAIWPASTEKTRWVRLFEERAARHAARLHQLGRSLSVSAIDAGPFDIDVSTEAFLAIVDSMLAVVESQPHGEDESGAEIQISIRPLHLGGRRGGRAGLQLCAELPPDPGRATLQPRAEHPALPGLRCHIRDCAGKLHLDGAHRIELWLPFA